MNRYCVRAWASCVQLYGTTHAYFACGSGAICGAVAICYGVVTSSVHCVTTSLSRFLFLSFALRSATVASSMNGRKKKAANRHLVVCNQIVYIRDFIHFSRYDISFSFSLKQSFHLCSNITCRTSRRWTHSRVMCIKRWYSATRKSDAQACTRNAISPAYPSLAYLKI